MRPSTLPWLATAAEPLPWRDRWSVTAGRVRRWEFWPSWLYYGPIVLWILWLGLRHRSPMAFTAANPGLEAGGLVGERKHHALAPLQANAPDLAATFELLHGEQGPQRIDAALAFAAVHGFPVVLKPDVGQRGRGVYIARDAAAVRHYLERFAGDVIVQRHVGGAEFGVFVARAPGGPLRILSIVHKTFPQVTGDGVRTLRALILADARARLIASALFARWHAELGTVPAAGAVVPLVEVGAHCRGSLFLDATHLATPLLAATLERLADAVPGYAFGRLDLRVPDAAHLQRGQGLQVLELNGVAAESAHIYHPGTPLLDGYRAMFRQWALAFEIGCAHARLGAATTGPIELLRRWRDDLGSSAAWF